VQNSSITEGCVIHGKVESSVIFAGVTVEEGAEIVQSILMPGTVVKKGAKVQYAILAEDVVIEEGAVVGEAPEEIEDLSRWGVAVVASGITVGKDAKIPAKATIEADVKDGEEVSAHA
jgi:glucose-1-phosphate adenylyltransferase